MRAPTPNPSHPGTPAPHPGGGAAPDQVARARAHRQHLSEAQRLRTGALPALSAPQCRVLATDGPPWPTYLGTDAKGRPVVEALVGIPNTLRTWAVLRNGDPTDVTQPVALVHREPDLTADQRALVARERQRMEEPGYRERLVPVPPHPAPRLPMLPAPTPPDPELATRRNLAAVMAQHPSDYIEGEPARYVLVERSINNGGWWVEYCPSPEAAAEAHDRQEHPEWWEAKALVDLETGQRWQAHTEVTYRTTWGD